MSVNNTSSASGGQRRSFFLNMKQNQGARFVSPISVGMSLWAVTAAVYGLDSYQPSPGSPKSAPASTKPRPAIIKSIPKTYDVLKSQETLWASYMKHEINWDDMMSRARKQEAEGRGALMKEWDIKPEGYNPKPAEDVVYRTGTDPSIEPGRGEFSDEDLTASTMNAWRQLREKAKNMGFALEHDAEAGFFRIPALNTVVWQPITPEPLLSDTRAFMRRMSVSGTNHEVVEPSSAKPKFPLEYVLAMVNKGQEGLMKPVEKWGKGYQRYELLIQTAKSTHHALKITKTGKENPRAQQMLWDLCKMKKSPGELGLFAPNDPEAKVVTALKNQQQVMQDLMRQSFRAAKDDLESQMDELNNRMESSKKRRLGGSLHRSVSLGDMTRPEPGARTRGARTRSEGDLGVQSQKLRHDLQEASVRIDKINKQLQSQVLSRKRSDFVYSLFADTRKKGKEEYGVFSGTIENFQRNAACFLEAARIAEEQAGMFKNIPYHRWDEHVRETSNA